MKFKSHEYKDVMIHLFKRFFKSKRQKTKTIEEMEQQKHEMKAQLELLIELEKKIKNNQQ
ncbi:hypothetical protein [uncultured Kordia sp.]|uniref:hypothetical protein n=1 Tax=uncultured Kordia sp. TaxID=507699 RepID=UPI002616DAC0|nr:hypothetical protein [uncultured Kordia sp.]